jgi:hypothetical protein
VKLKTGEDLVVELGSSPKARAFLDGISEQVYGYLYDNERPAHGPVIEYMIAKKQPVPNNATGNGVYAHRKAIIKAMLEQVKYALASDGDLVEYQTGLDITRGTAIDINEIRGRRMIASGAERALRSVGLLRGLE